MSLCLQLDPQQDFIVKIIQKTKPEFGLFIAVTINNITIKGENVMVNFSNVGESVNFRLVIKDKKGRPAAIDGEITVANSNEIAGGVAFDQVTRSGKLTCLDEGIGQVAFTADADLGSGVKAIAATLDFTGPDLTQASVFTVEVDPIDPAPSA